MDIVRREKQKERFVFVLLNKFIGFLNPLVSQIFIAESGRMPARIKTDAADTIVNGRIMTV